MNEIRLPLPPTDEPRPDPGRPDAEPVVIVAPELRDRRDLVVVREPGESDADYQARCELFALLREHIERG